MNWKAREKELNQLRAKHGTDRSRVRSMPSYKSEGNANSSYRSLSDGFAPVCEVKRVLPTNHGLYVGTLHKQGPMVLSKSELIYAGGKKV
jgi:hypothetical protein